MQANDITRERLRRLADTRPAEGKVLSLFLNLDPREFATAPARGTEIRSMLDRAARQVRDDESLTHEERAALRADLERLQAEIGNGGLDAKGAHGVAVFASGPANLFEVLKLSEPIEHAPVIADTPFIEPLTAIGTPERWCVVLVNRRSARLLCGSGGRLEEVAHVDDDVHGQHDQGGWSQANYQRSVEKEASDHLRRTAEVAFAHLKGALPAGILVGAPQELVNDFENELHPYRRESSTAPSKTSATRRRRTSSARREPSTTRRWPGSPRSSAPPPAARPAARTTCSPRWSSSASRRS